MYSPPENAAIALTVITIFAIGLYLFYRTHRYNADVEEEERGRPRLPRPRGPVYQNDMGTPFERYRYIAASRARARLRTDSLVVHSDDTTSHEVPIEPPPPYTEASNQPRGQSSRSNYSGHLLPPREVKPAIEPVWKRWNRSDVGNTAPVEDPVLLRCQTNDNDIKTISARPTIERTRSLPG